MIKLKDLENTLIELNGITVENQKIKNGFIDEEIPIIYKFDLFDFIDVLQEKIPILQKSTQEIFKKYITDPTIDKVNLLDFPDMSIEYENLMEKSLEVKIPSIPYNILENLKTKNTYYTLYKIGLFQK